MTPSLWFLIATAISVAIGGFFQQAWMIFPTLVLWIISIALEIHARKLRNTPEATIARYEREMEKLKEKLAPFRTANKPAIQIFLKPGWYYDIKTGLFKNGESILKGTLAEESVSPRKNPYTSKYDHLGMGLPFSTIIEYTVPRLAEKPNLSPTEARLSRSLMIWVDEPDKWLESIKKWHFIEEAYLGATLPTTLLPVPK